MLTRTELLDQATSLRRDAADTTPGRVSELIDRRVAQLLQLPGAVGLPDDLDEAEQLVVDLTEQFLIDVHGITDAQFAALSEHYSNEDQVAIMFHLAFADGFGKLSKVHADSADVIDPTSQETS